MKYDFIIFGGTGLQGRICSRDLLESGYSVLIAGRDISGVKDLLKREKAGFLRVDLRKEREIVKSIELSGAKIVVNCAELTFNIPIMKACLKIGKSLTDLGGMHKVTMEQFKLDKEFRKKGIINITGCGSTPGIVNVMVADAVRKFDSVDTISLGFAWNSNIKEFVIPYSIQSIFDELTSPPVTFHNGKFIKEDRAFCRGTMDFKEVGRQTVYCIVHSEVYTFAKYFKKKRVKNIHYMAGFPEHSLRTIQTLIDLGFNSQKEIEVNGTKTTPVDFTTKVLKRISVPKGYKETEDLWANIEGIRDGRKYTEKIDCIIRTQKGWEYAGSNVDTGRTISIISQMLFKELIKESGVFAPEAVIPHKPFFKELAKRKMHIYSNGKRIN